MVQGRSSYEEQQFNDPYKMSVTHRYVSSWFKPVSAAGSCCEWTWFCRGTLLVVEDTSRRVQEVNVSDGSCIRVIKSSEFSVRIQAVACTDQLIAVGAMSSFSTAGNRISLFGFDDGKLLRWVYWRYEFL